MSTETPVNEPPEPTVSESRYEAVEWVAENAEDDVVRRVAQSLVSNLEAKS